MRHDCEPSFSRTAIYLNASRSSTVVQDHLKVDLYNLPSQFEPELKVILPTFEVKGDSSACINDFPDRTTSTAADELFATTPAKFHNHY